jgi:hypothetical protein
LQNPALTVNTNAGYRFAPPSLAALMFIRFVIHRKDSDSGRRLGLFQAMSDLEHSGDLLSHEQNEYDEIYEWFRTNLKRPRGFTRSSKPHAKNVALSWFKSTAVEHIARMHVLARLLRDHGIEVDELRTERPGYIVYEDPFQVAAEPFKETST